VKGVSKIRKEGKEMEMKLQRRVVRKKGIEKTKVQEKDQVREIQ
jgi:hypothetical protein